MYLHVYNWVKYSKFKYDYGLKLYKPFGMLIEKQLDKIPYSDHKGNATINVDFNFNSCY